MINSFTAYFKYGSRTLFTVLSIVLTLNVSTTVAQQELSAFSYVDKNTAKNSNDENVLPSAQADGANVTQQQGIETWHISLNDQISGLSEGDTLDIPLPYGQVLSTTVTARKEFKNGDVQLMAGSAESDSRIILTIGSNIAFGSIVNSSDKVNFSISLDNDANLILIDQDTLPASSIDFTDDMVEPDLGHGGSPQALETTAQSPASEADETNGKTNIDILFVYSPEFETLFGSAETRINQLIAFTNQAYDDTGILINLRVAGAVELADIENNDTVGTLLTGARTSDDNEGFGDVSALRDQTGGDFVAVLTTSSSNFSSNGTAFVIGNSPSFAFSSTKLGLFCCDIVFAHEIGHNLGSGHQRAELLLPANSGISACTGGFTGFSCGHSVNENGSTNWSTIMASGNNIGRINLFSNVDPNLTAVCDGDPCGIAEGQSGAADNLSSFNFTRIATSQYRDEAVPEPEDNFLLDIIPAIIGSFESTQ